MATLAIKGHATRGKEVIEILEMLGGRNASYLSGNEDTWCYFIDENNKIELTTDIGNIVYSIEQFLEKFPYKVGDKVLYHECKSEIISMEWKEDDVVYTVLCKGTKWETTSNFLQPYTEQEPLVIKENFYDSPCTGSVRAEEQTYLNPKAEKGKEEIKENLKEAKTIMEETITIDDSKANTKEWLIDKLESMSKDNALQAICNIHDELHKPQYPKTYEECCEELLLDIDTLDTCHNHGYACSLLGEFQKLLICRDAYWKMADDWKPLDAEEGKTFCIYYNRFLDNLEKASGIFDANAILDFPTEEMRDNFFENFKDLIEECKELL